jgi:hypothetical protein
MKTSQREIVIKQIKETGEVTRNWCLNQYISRLSAIIQDLEEDGWEFKAVKQNGDYIYKVTKSRYKRVEYYVPALNKTIFKYERV